MELLKMNCNFLFSPLAQSSGNAYYDTNTFFSEKVCLTAVICKSVFKLSNLPTNTHVVEKCTKRIEFYLKLLCTCV